MSQAPTPATALQLNTTTSPSYLNALTPSAYTHTGGATPGSALPFSQSTDALVDPDLFDLRQLLHETLSRLRLHQAFLGLSDTQPNTQTQDSSGTDTMNSMNGANGINGIHGMNGVFTSEDPARNPFSREKPLDLRDLQAEMSKLKGRLRKARAAIAGVPGIERDVADLNEEAEYLRARVEAMRDVLARTGVNVG